MTSKRIALITGATSGIGEATARLLANNNFKLILTGRRSDRLQKLKDELKERTDILTLEFDVRDRKAVSLALQSLGACWCWGCMVRGFRPSSTA